MTKNKGGFPKGKKKNSLLTAQQFEFIKLYKGDPKEAMIAAGYKWNRQMQYKLMNKKRVKEALAAKQNAAAQAGGAKIGRAVSITRNDIIMGLADIAQKGESESARVSAYSKLSDIFGLDPKKAPKDDFAGWFEEEIVHYYQTGKFPPRLYGLSPGEDDGKPTNTPNPN